MIIKNDYFEIGGKPILYHVVFKPPLRVLESMEDEACYIFSVNGRANIHGPLEKVSLNSREGALMKCGKYVNKWIRSENQHYTEIFIIKLYPELIKSIFSDDFPKITAPVLFKGGKTVQKVRTDKVIETYVKGLAFYFDNPSLVTDELVALKVRELILLLAQSDENIIVLLSDLFRPDAHALKKVVEKHMFDELAIEELANLSGMSESSFKRKFKLIFGESPWRYIRKKRLEKAAELLQVSSSRIAEIGYACGFSEPAYFAKSFKSEFGVTPRKFRLNITRIS